MISPRERLAGALSIADVPNVATLAGITPRQAANAIKGRPTTATAYLRLCVACGLDPAPGLPYGAVVPSDFAFDFLGLAVRLTRRIRAHSDRDAAKVLGVAPATICRLERGDTVSIGVVLRACEYVGVHPFGYCKTNAEKLVSVGSSRETRIESVS
jgi:DNA-binding XRE family transcriptional regulator